MKNTMKKLAAILLVAALMLTATCGLAEMNAEDLRYLDTYYTLVTNYIAKADYEKASEYLAKCFEYCGEDTSTDLMADLYLKRGCIETINGDNEAALADLDKALELDGELTDAWLVKTQIYTETMELASATESLLKYIELTGDNTLYVTAAELCELNGDMEKAAEYYEKYLEAAGLTGNEAVYTAAVYKMQIGLSDAAATDFETLTKDETYGEAALYNIAVCTMNKGEHDAAAELFVAGMAESDWGNKYQGTYYNLGLCYLLVGKYDQAEENFKISIEKNEYVDDANQNLGICKMSREDYEGAVAAFTALEHDGQALAAETAFYRACCYVSLGKNEEALKDFTYCIDNGYELGESYYQRSLIYGAMGETDLQTADLEASIQY